jgi:hypothetical protein
MGFDLSGKSGNYFQNNVWWWRPLWHFVCESCDGVLTEDDRCGGAYNDGHFIDPDKCQKIVAELTSLLESGAVKGYERDYMNCDNTFPEDPCEICATTGWEYWALRDDAWKRLDIPPNPPPEQLEDGPFLDPDKIYRRQCFRCLGSGKEKPISATYPFSEENVREFVAFVKDSNGFCIY